MQNAGQRRHGCQNPQQIAIGQPLLDGDHGQGADDADPGEGGDPADPEYEGQGQAPFPWRHIPQQNAKGAGPAQISGPQNGIAGPGVRG